MPRVFLNVVMLNVVMVSVVAPPEVQKRGWRRLDYFSNNYRRIQEFWNILLNLFHLVKFSSYKIWQKLCQNSSNLDSSILKLLKLLANKYIILIKILICQNFGLRNLRIVKFENSQIWESSNLGIIKCDNHQIWELSNFQLIKFDNHQIWESSNLRIIKC